MPAAEAAYEPLVLVDTSTLTEEQWLDYRRLGIGGSDAAAVLGISPFRTARDLYYDKLNIASVVDDDGNWVAMKMGHLLEDLVAEIFSRKTGFKVYQVKKMFQHPQYPYMLADVDYFIELPGGGTAILEIKTTNYNAKGNWWKDGEEIVPDYYEAQGRHYMAVTNLDEVYFCCLYGNNEDEVIIRRLKRDLSYESELMALEGYFWTDHVQARVPPPYREDGDTILASSQRHTGPANPDAGLVELGQDLKSRFAEYLALQKQKQSMDRCVKEVKEELDRLRAIITAEMGQSCRAHCALDGVDYEITYNPVRKRAVGKDDLLRLKLLYPDIYDEFVGVSEYRKFDVKQVKAETA